MTTFPTWLTGPGGERRIFERAEDVPEGWVDGLHPSVRAAGVIGVDVAAFAKEDAAPKRPKRGRK